jgi:cell wall-associated NlpC family hydrolase
MLRHAFTSLAALACLAAGLLTAPTAQATTDPGAAALTWAEHNAAGHPYAWGGTGPYSFDCSGLIYAAFRAEGIDLPRTTYEMLGSRLLERTYHPRPGDLAFFGAGHVELVTASPDVTFGAHDTGTRVGFIRNGGTFQPDAYYRVEAP